MAPPALASGTAATREPAAGLVAAAGGAPSGAAVAGEVVGADGAVAAGEEAALATARRTGAPVEVIALRTDRARTVAQPDGSLTLEQGLVPERMRRPDGTWAAIDPTLRSAGGAVRPAVVPVDTRLSAGGSGPLASVRTSAGSLTLSWPGRLPAPTLAGDTAMYRDVLPGVDLAVLADADGFRHVLVLRSRQAALRLAGRDLRFGLGGTLTAHLDAQQNLTFTDRSGAVVFGSSGALMWDSATDAARREGGDPARSVVAEPGAGARRAAVGLALHGRDLVLTPDPALLTDPATVFPLYIDPSYAKGYKRFAFSNSANESNTSVARVGRSPASGARYRSYFTFDVSALRGKHILHAEFHTTMTHSWSCSSTPVNLYRVAGHGSGRLAWSGPALRNWLDQRSGHAHKPSGAPVCSNDPQPNMPMEFSGKLTADVQAAANANWTEFPLGLSTRKQDGTGESTTSWWKKFSKAASKLVVTYNSRPGTPTSLSTDGRGCATGSSRPVISTATPTLRAKMSDPDAGDNDLKASFGWQRYDTSVTPAVWRALGSGQQSALRSGATAQYRIGSGLVNDGIYRWRVRALDPWTYGSSTGTDVSAWTGWCEFVVDLVGPGVAPGVSSPVYGTDLNAVYGGVGRSAPFTFTASGVTDVASYRWGWADPPTTTVPAPAAGAAVTLPLTPPPPKPHDPTSGGLVTLYVISVDRAGRSSPANAYTFNLGSATAPVARWAMDEPAGTATVTDSLGGGHAATVSGGTLGTRGRLVDGATALSLDGVDDYASAPGVPFDTSGSFTVSAWARVSGSPAATGTGRAIVTASGTRASAFFLRRAADGRWMFGAAESDTDDSAQTNLWGTSVSKPGVWTHVVGVYDAGARQVRLYVNGVKEASAARAGGVFKAGGSVEFGRTKWKGDINYEPLWQGSMADVTMWDRVLSGEEIATMPATLTGRWTLDGDGSDATPFHRTATGPDTVGWVDDRNGLAWSAAAFNGTDEALTTSGPVLRTDQSYTVSAWLRLDEPFPSARTVLGQDRPGSNGAFFLGYRPLPSGTSGWALSTWTPAGGWVESHTPVTAEADIGSWVHLAAVYDVQAGQQRLYVNGALAAANPLTGTPTESGALSIGRGYNKGAPVDWFPGAVDEVRTYQGVLPDGQIEALAAL